MNTGYQGYASMGAGGDGGGQNYGQSNYNSGYGGYNTNSNQYNQDNWNGGADNSGGFMPYSGSQDNQNKERSESQDTIHPMNIMQIMEVPAGDSEKCYMLGNLEVQNVYLVARVNNISVQTTKVVYRLDDGTGSIEADRWISPDKQDLQPNEKQASGVVEQIYVRVFGKIKSQQSKRTIAIATIKPVTDMNEVFAHVLDVICHHFFATKGSINELTNAQLGGHHQETSMVGGVSSGPNVGYQQNQGGTDAANPRLQSVSITARRVFGVIQNANNPQGVHYYAIAQQLGLSQAEIQRAGEELISSGLVYTPEDDDTWAKLEM